MAFYSGQASSYQELLDVLINACVTKGWTWADGILSKGKAFIRPFVSTTATTAQGRGIIIQGGTGKTGSNLDDPSVAKPRLGALGAATSKSTEVIFPCDYNIHIFNDPDEVYLVVNFSIDRFYYLAFGLSNVNLIGTGLWLMATASSGYDTTGLEGNSGWDIGSSGGGVNGYYFACGPFWQTTFSTNTNLRNHIIHTGLNSTGWQQTGNDTQQSATNAVHSIRNIITRLPNNFFSETTFLPIQILNYVLSNKCSMVADLRNARYLRIDNFEPNQIITIGSVKWKIYPFYRKNIANRSGGNYGITHTGTFGWAIRYDGP